jgi:PAS domain S-box-containing protein
MARIRFSILRQFMVYVGIFLLIIIGLASTTIVVLRSETQSTIELDQKWLEGATLLGNVDYAVSAFRLAEAQRALVPSEKDRLIAEAAANEQRQLVNSRMDQYEQLLGKSASSPALLAFQNAWRTYQRAHDAWGKADTAGLIDEPGYVGSTLDQQYHATDDAIDHLIDFQRDEAQARAAVVERITRLTSIFVSVISGATICLAVWLVYMIRGQIIQPLVAITGAISMLASGAREVQVPKINRKDEIGEMAAACEVFRINVLALDQAHAATRAAEKQFTALFTSSVDAIISQTLDGIVTNLNPAAERLFGYSARELIGQPITLLFPTDRADEERQILARIQNGEDVEHFETIRRRKNGELFPASITISTIRDSSGAIVGASKIARDITEQKLAELELRQHRDHLADLVSIATTEVAAIVQTATSGIVTFDANGVIDVFNPSAEKLFGWRKAEIAGQNVSVLMAAPFASQYDHDLANFRATAISNILGREQEILARRKDGSIFPAHFSVGHSAMPASKHFFVGFITDISEQKKTERILQQAKEDAEAGARAKAAFVANMSHEIRTPMNAILGFADVLQDTQLSPQAAQHVRIIQGSAKALLAILNDILDVSKLESGKVTLEAVAFHLPNALGEALRLVEPQATAKGLNIALEYDAALPVRCLGDPTRLRQVVLNLVGNALKFTEQGGVTLSVKPAGTADMLHFAITDTGIGMTPRQMAAVFEPFSQADTSTTRRFGGTGLGTAISKQIVGLMGGKIWIDSEFGKGSTFHFTAHLPGAASGASCLYEGANAIAEDYVSPRRFNVLLAEDLDTNATLAMLRLRRLGHRVDWRQNGQETVSAYQAGGYDLILMDIMMPVMNGLDATRAIRKLESPGTHIPIIALTASAMREDYDLCVAAGMDQVQAKPMDFNALLATMEQVVPAGRGQPNTVDRPNTIDKIETVDSTLVDFSPLDGIADHRGALASWRDPAVYAKALAGFAADHAGDATALETLLRAGLQADMGNAEPARALAHTLKGVAGNLGITQVAQEAGAIETRLKAGQHQAALAELAQLRQPLAAAVKAIHGLGAPNHDGATTATDFEPAVAVVLLGEFSAALEKRNPYSAEPILARLAKYLPKTDLAPLWQQLDAFDFKGAKAKAKILAETLSRHGD